MNVVHIFKNTNAKFYESYIQFINKNFKPEEHCFMIEVYNKSLNKFDEENVEFIEKVQYFQLIKQLYLSKKIILHALMSPRMVLILSLQPWLLKKCYWVIWGSDLYYHKDRKRNLKVNIYELFRTFIIKRMAGLVTQIEGDYELAKEWYGAKGKHYYSFMYTSNLYKEYNLETVDNEGETYIQIGNSADSSNNHIDMLRKLEKYKDKDIRIICPLSYGDINHRDKIIKEGKDIFGDKFIPLTDFLPFEEYLDLLAKIDIAIFNHERQQAMGNITTLLGLGKKVYIRDDITTWGFCQDKGLKVFSSNNEFENLFVEIDEKVKQENVSIIKRDFSEEKLISDWNDIFQA